MQMTMDFEDFQKILKERDDLKAKVAKLEAEPLAFSLKGLARKVSDKMTSLTNDQRRRMESLITGEE